MPTVYCDECAKPLSTSEAFLTEGGGALCAEQAPPAQIEIQVDRCRQPLCPQCGTPLECNAALYYNALILHVEEGSLIPSLSYEKPDSTQVLTLQCPTCDFSVDREVTDIVFTS